MIDSPSYCVENAPCEHRKKNNNDDSSSATTTEFTPILSSICLTSALSLPQPQPEVSSRPAATATATAAAVHDSQSLTAADCSTVGLQTTNMDSPIAILMRSSSITNRDWSKSVVDDSSKSSIVPLTTTTTEGLEHLALESIEVVGGNHNGNNEQHQQMDGIASIKNAAKRKRNPSEIEPPDATSQSPFTLGETDFNSTVGLAPSTSLSPLTSSCMSLELPQRGSAAAVVTVIPAIDRTSIILSSTEGLPIAPANVVENLDEGEEQGGLDANGVCHMTAIGDEATEPQNKRTTNPTARTNPILRLGNAQQEHRGTTKTDHTTTTTTTTATSTQSSALPETTFIKRQHGEHDVPMLLDMQDVGQLFFAAGLMAMVVWIMLLVTVYVYALAVPLPDEQWDYITGREREAAGFAFGVMFVACLLLFSPIAVSSYAGRAPIGGFIYATLVMQIVLMATYCILAFFPTLVLVDPVTQNRVYLVRWCKWTALAGFMTFLSDTIDLPNESKSMKRAGTPSSMMSLLTSRSLRKPMFLALSQSVSCWCGLLLPFCPNVWSWSLVMIVFLSTFAVMVPHLKKKYRAYKANSPSSAGTFLDWERFDRSRFAYHLMMVYVFARTVLLSMFFLNMLLFRLLPTGHLLRHQSMPMAIDIVINVIAKVTFMRLIVDIHQSAFDHEGRARRQLSALRRLMAILWDSSSDAIVVSVRDGDKVISMFSPSFPVLLGATSMCVDSKGKSAALLLETEMRCWQKSDTLQDSSTFILGSSMRSSNFKAGDSDDMDNGIDHDHLNATAAFYMDSGEIPCSGAIQESILGTLGPDDPMVKRATQIGSAAWSRLRSPNEYSSSLWTRAYSNGVSDSTTSSEQQNSSMLLLQSIERLDGEECRCEIKISIHAENAIVAVVRDVTERHRRFDAERRAHAEAVARQRDAQTVNRFTRHEIKNGLLSGIELCDSLRKALDELEHTYVSSGHWKSPAINCASREMSSIISSKFSDNLGIFSSGSAAHNRDSSPSRSINKNGPCTNLNPDQATTTSILPRRYMDELDKALHEILDTVLAEAMARDVIHEVYQPRTECLDLKAVLTSSGVGQSERFPLVFEGADMPNFQLDPQLLRYIHRNAISNACKYGEIGGEVLTKVSFDGGSSILKLQVINQPGIGHEELVIMGEAASEAVFQQGSRLHSYFDIEQRHMSSGDGAWIMQKCAKTMRGTCAILFEMNQTIFTFECKTAPVEPLADMDEFAVPPDTWGVAVDDSKIQRKLMQRILSHAGVEESRQIILGQTFVEIQELENTIAQLTTLHPKSNVMVLIDENLDFQESTAEKEIILSGSVVMNGILEKLTPAQESRIICLVRSANDSASDIEVYTRRAHGVFPKAPMRRERVREILFPLWKSRFYGDQGKGALIADADQNSGSATAA